MNEFAFPADTPPESSASCRRLDPVIPLSWSYVVCLETVGLIKQIAIQSEVDVVQCCRLCLFVCVRPHSSERVVSVLSCSSVHTALYKTDWRTPPIDLGGPIDVIDYLLHSLIILSIG